MRERWTERFVVALILLLIGGWIKTREDKLAEHEQRLRMMEVQIASMSERVNTAVTTTVRILDHLEKD